MELNAVVDMSPPRWESPTNIHVLYVGRYKDIDLFVKPMNSYGVADHRIYLIRKNKAAESFWYAYLREDASDIMAGKLAMLRARKLGYIL